MYYRQVRDVLSAAWAGAAVCFLLGLFAPPPVFSAPSDSMLAGKTLAPFWRGTPGQGVNLRRVFTEPTPFDLVLWVQGTGAAPYLEKGTATDPEFWRMINRVFRGEFLHFAIWFN